MEFVWRPVRAARLLSWLMMINASIGLDRFRWVFFLTGEFFFQGIDTLFLGEDDFDKLFFGLSQKDLFIILSFIIGIPGGL
jgi:hypothetical protein